MQRLATTHCQHVIERIVTDAVSVQTHSHNTQTLYILTPHTVSTFLTLDTTATTNIQLPGHLSSHSRELPRETLGTVEAEIFIG